MEPKTETESEKQERVDAINAAHLANSGEHIAQFFAFAHLPPHLAVVSRPFTTAAVKVLELPRNPERTVALRKLLEAKDAAVRAVVAK